ncbi:MAG: 3'-5' exonuclease [Leptospiraceae bacterium]|nr:3'-5' exonuclease [Leptospiraceae bacterium]
MNSLLENLNESQKQAVLHTEGPLLILAGAGSGKTRVITHRIAHLVTEKRVFPYRICALTFTNKAAGEMKARVISLLPNSGQMVMIKTFHSLCLYIVRMQTEKLNLKPGFTVYDTSLMESLAKEVVKDLGLDVKKFSPSFVVSSIQKAKDNLITETEFIDPTSKDPIHKAISTIYYEYENRKFKRNAIDFGDLIMKTVLLLKNDKELQEKYNQIWEYIMIDEYQDTNKAQYELTLLLAGAKKNLCVVGDDDQSIYSWRGADIRNILGFEKDFPSSLVVKLEENYRSTANIIAAASSIIKNNSSRKEKNIFSNKEKGSKIKVIPCSTESDEASLIIQKIKKGYEKHRSYKRYAIFYRTNAQSRFIEEALRGNAIAYKIVGGFRFFDRAEIKDLIAYLSVMINPEDNTSLLRIINFPPRGIGDVTIEKLRVESNRRNESLFESLQTIDGLRKGVKASIDEFISAMKDMISINKEKKIRPSEIVRELVKKIKLEEAYNESEEESIDRVENIEQFILAIEEYESESPDPSIEDYLSQISLITSEEEKKEETDYVTLMTVHNSKGLEFQEVFLSGMQEGTFPHFMSMEDDRLEEERRLCYVAVTRAREQLTISHVLTVRRMGEFLPAMPSRFLDEIPYELLDIEQQNFYRTPEYAPRAGNRFVKEKLDNTPRSVNAKIQPNLKPGNKVKHKDFGIGKVISVSGSGDNLKAKIMFGLLEKNFLLSYTQFEIID